MNYSLYGASQLPTTLFSLVTHYFTTHYSSVHTFYYTCAYTKGGMPISQSYFPLLTIVARQQHIIVTKWCFLSKTFNAHTRSRTFFWHVPKLEHVIPIVLLNACHHLRILRLIAQKPNVCYEVLPRLDICKVRGHTFIKPHTLDVLLSPAVVPYFVYFQRFHRSEQSVQVTLWTPDSSFSISRSSPNL